MRPGVTLDSAGNRLCGAGQEAAWKAKLWAPPGWPPARRLSRPHSKGSWRSGRNRDSRGRKDVGLGRGPRGNTCRKLCAGPPRSVGQALLAPGVLTGSWCSRRLPPLRPWRAWPTASPQPICPRRWWTVLRRRACTPSRRSAPDRGWRGLAPGVGEGSPGRAEGGPRRRRLKAPARSGLEGRWREIGAFGEGDGGGAANGLLGCFGLEQRFGAMLRDGALEAAAAVVPDCNAFLGTFLL